MLDALYLPKPDLERLFAALQAADYTVDGPRVTNGVIQFDRLDGPDGLPWGISDDQDAGRYRLVAGPAHRAFTWTTAPQALKPLTFPPRETLWSVTRSPDGQLGFEEHRPPQARRAVIGVRACDLAGLDIQDRHFGAREDPWFLSRRNGLFIVAVNCARSAPTCFCAATGDGPAVTSGYDLLLDELDESFLVWAGSNEGEALIARLGLAAASTDQVEAAAAQQQAASEMQKRRIPEGRLETALEKQRSSPVWDSIAQRCLACGNCTAVCPTCFCHRHTEAPALDATASTHGREWDSCFSEGHSLAHGHPLRRDIAHRYRQWLSHKLGAWHTQYGRSGCTGCGRCITWCPVGIDLTVSISAVLAGTQE